MLDIQKTLIDFNKFASDREWEQFHDIKNLSMALTVEVSELLEIFQWAKPEQIQAWIDKDPAKRKMIDDEIADILLYLIKLSSLTKTNIPAAIESKMRDNAKKYPVEKAKGNAKKYTEL